MESTASRRDAVSGATIQRFLSDLGGVLASRTPQAQAGVG